MLWILSGIAAVAFLGLALPWLLKRPSHDREWQRFSRVLPRATFAGDTVTIHDLRDFTYTRREEIKDERYLDRTYDLNRLESVWFLKENFARYEGFAHTFLSFGFADGDYLVLSIEARKEVGEEYSGWKGLWRQFDLMYLAGTERDFIGRRTHHSDAPVFLYPVRIDRAGARALLVDMLERMNRIFEKPEFYNTLISNCTNNLYRHAERSTGVDVPITWNTLMPGFSDIAAHRLGIIPNDQPIEAIRCRYSIDPTQVALDDPEFSKKIRRP